MPERCLNVTADNWDRHVPRLIDSLVGMLVVQVSPYRSTRERENRRTVDLLKDLGLKKASDWDLDDRKDGING